MYIWLGAKNAYDIRKMVWLYCGMTSQRLEIIEMGINDGE